MHMPVNETLDQSLATSVTVMPPDYPINELPSSDFSIIGPAWEQKLLAFLSTMPAGEAKRELAETRFALMQAEEALRIQEERIRSLEALSTTDELTGLLNRRGFVAAFDRELGLARRDATEGGVLVMIDLDGFKRINDTLGHQAGDAYLNCAALALQEGVRGTDIVARLGGDEFVILFTSMDEEHAAKRLAKLQRFFMGRSLVWKGQRIPLRASFGASPYSGINTAEAIMHVADVRLYAHKAYNRKLIAS